LRLNPSLRTRQLLLGATDGSGYGAPIVLPPVGISGGTHRSDAHNLVFRVGGDDIDVWPQAGTTSSSRL
jgi:hypothetical protein